MKTYQVGRFLRTPQRRSHAKRHHAETVAAREAGAPFQISGSTGTMTVILGTLTAKYGMQGILISCFFAGAILIVAGILKPGRRIYYIFSSVITEFMSGTTIIIALGQLDNFFCVMLRGSLAI